jgi:hypothetical protein
MITFQEFLELAESSSPERGRRRVGPRGPYRNKYLRLKQRTDTANKVALKKAGFKRPVTGKDSPWEHETASSSDHHTVITTDANQSDFALQHTPAKKLGTGDGVMFRGGKSDKVVPTSKRVSRLKTLRKQLGGDRTSKPVHDVAIYADDDYPKNHPTRLSQRQTSFKQELRGGLDSLRRAGAKPGDKVAFSPSALMTGENPKKGKKKRDNIYARQFGARMNPKTGITVGTMK